MNRKIVFVLLFALILNFYIFGVSAAVSEEIDKFYTENYDKWVYREDIRGSGRGFRLEHFWRTPKYKFTSNFSDSDGNIFNSNLKSFNPDSYPPRDSYVAVSKALDVFVSHRAGRYYPSYGYSGYGYQRNYW